MGYSFKECKQNELENLLQQYVNTLSSPFDSFLEDHILRSTFYSINENSETVGCFAVLNNKVLTQFYLELSRSRGAQEIFNCIIQTHAIESMLVPTCDELFLSMVVDHDYKIEKQAYFFQDSHVEIPLEKLYKGGFFKLAVLDDIKKITEISKDFLDKHEERIENGEIFTFTKNNTLLGIGVLEKSAIRSRYASIGMFTNEQFRKQGIGRTIIHHLKEWCYTNNLIPICGCWYYNVDSKRTLESAGMVTKTRLLNIKVK